VRAVEVTDLVMRYGRFEAVAGLSFTADHGVVTVVLGPNGAGKTSTIEACEGYRAPTSGTVRVLGLDPLSHQRRLAEKMGVMLQDGGVYPSARVSDVAELYCALHGGRADAAELIDQVGLAERATTTWRRLSGGEKQRLSLAMALAGKPDVAFLDEATSGVDVGGRALIRAIIRELADGGCCVVLATHELDEAERVADRVIIIDRGRILADGSLAQVRGTAQELRFRVAGTIDRVALAVHLDRAVRMYPNQPTGSTEYVVAGGSDGALISRLTTWLTEQHVEPLDLRAGSPRLEDVFLRLTGASQ
jgi:ABC-2 type transport system ATP-binding protein